MGRLKDQAWNIPEPATWDGAKVALLMDIRDELQHLNRTLDCPNFQNIPRTLTQIARNTTKRKRVKR